MTGERPLGFTLCRTEDLLTAEELRQLRDDLAAMAQARRAALASAANIWLD